MIFKWLNESEIMMEGDKIEADLPLIIDNIRAGMGVGLLFPVILLIMLFIFARQKFLSIKFMGDMMDEN